MKQSLRLLFFAISLTSVFELTATGPIMPAALLTTITELSTALQNDNLSTLKTFIKNNPQFQWNEIYSHLPWTVEAQTPLSAASWLGASKCLSYLLKKNIGKIKNSFNIPSSRGFSALHYAQNPPKRSIYPNQTSTNYTKIIKTLQKYGAK